MLPDSLKTQLQRYGLFAKKRLGQHFLTDEAALDDIVAAADLRPTDTVVEVGAGTGLLTTRLASRCGRLLAVEYDRTMIPLLEENVGALDTVEIFNEDILNFNIQNLNKGYKVVANIPYYITSPLLKHFLQSDNRPSLMVLLVQKEVAEKVCGLTGKSMTTIQTQVFGKPSIVRTVPAASFYPAPKVDSAVLKIEVYQEPLVPHGALNDFFRLAGFGFSQKRKKLANALAAGLHREPSEVRETLQKAGFDPNARAEQLNVEDWKRLIPFCSL